MQRIMTGWFFYHPKKFAHSHNLYAAVGYSRQIKALD